MPTRTWPVAARDGEELPHQDNGQDWIVSWHPPSTPPAGTPHGAAGICLTGDAGIVLVQNAGGWEIPAGRPEDDENWEETLRREMKEEACVAVTEARFLGFTRGPCVRGAQQGHVIVRSVWRAEVELRPWKPQFEMTDRLVIPSLDVWNRLTMPESESMARINARMLVEAGIPPSPSGLTLASLHRLRGYVVHGSVRPFPRAAFRSVMPYHRKETMTGPGPAGGAILVRPSSLLRLP